MFPGSQAVAHAPRGDLIVSSDGFQAGGPQQGWGRQPETHCAQANHRTWVLHPVFYHSTPIILVVPGYHLGEAAVIYGFSWRRCFPAGFAPT